MTLTKTAQTFRLVVKVIGIMIVVIIALRTTYVIYKLLFPDTPPAPPEDTFTAKFGAISPLSLEVASVQFSSPYTARLDLLDYQLPQVPKIAYIYPILKSPYGFLSEDRAVEIAKVFGLSGEPIKLNASESRWTGPNKYLTINTVNLNFSYQYKYSLDNSVFKVGTFSSQNQAINFSKTLLSQYNVIGNFADDLSNGQTQVDMLKYLNQKLQPVHTIAEASAIRVGFIRNNVSFTLGTNNYSFPFVSPKYVGTTTYTLVGTSSNNALQALEVYYRLWRYSTTDGSTYPMITSQTAWENIQRDPATFTVYAGNLELGPMDRSTSTPIISGITVKRVYFAYYDTDAEQNYLQPVWVFVGKATLATNGQIDWIGYVPAIDPTYVKTSE